MLFVGRDKLLLVTSKQTMQLFDLSSSDGIKAVHTFDAEQKFQFEDAIHLLDASADGRFAVVADHQSKIVVVDLKSLELHSVLPRYKSHPTALAFHPNSKLIVVAYSDHKVEIIIFVVVNNRLILFDRITSACFILSQRTNYAVHFPCV